MTHKRDQQTKASLFYELHHSGNMLVLPNIWDPLGALLLEDVGYPAIATASASIAYSNGYDDGEQIPFDELLKKLRRIASIVNIPVTADIESGYSNTDSGLRENIKSLIKAGVVGINIEDSDERSGLLVPVEVQYERISLIRKVADEAGVHLFINARTDVYIKEGAYEESAKLSEAIKRGAAYKEAGADCFYPICVTQINHIREIVSNLAIPVNILAIPGIPDFKTLKELGVSRVSLGPGFLKIAIKAMKNMAERLLHFEGLEEISANEMTSDYLKKLVTPQ